MSARIYINHIRRILNQKLTNYQNTDNQWIPNGGDREGMMRDIVYVWT